MAGSACLLTEQAGRHPYRVSTPDRAGGFAIFEVVIAIALGALLLIYASEFLVQRTGAQDQQQETTDVQQDARLALDVMMREIGMAGYHVSGDALAGFVSARPDTVTVAIDLNEDGDTSDAGEQVTYALFDVDSDGDLDLGRTSGPLRELVAADLQSLSFTYYLADGGSTSTPGDLGEIRRVRATVIVRDKKPAPSYRENDGYSTWSVSRSVPVAHPGGSD